MRTEGARSSPQQSFGFHQIAELRHGDAAKSERRRVVAQGDPLQGAEDVTGRECARGGRDHRIHRNPVTLVTPIVSTSGVKFNSWKTTTEWLPEREKHYDGSHDRNT